MTVQILKVRNVTYLWDLKYIHISVLGNNAQLLYFHSISGVKNKFLVRTAGSGSGILACSVDGPSKVALSCKENDDGYEFMYSPYALGKYMIVIKYGGVPIAGSPFLSEVTG